MGAGRDAAARLNERLGSIIEGLLGGWEDLAMALEALALEARSALGCDWRPLEDGLGRYNALASPPRRAACGWPVVYKDNYSWPGEAVGLGVAAGIRTRGRHSSWLEVLVENGAAPAARGNMHPLGLGVTNVNAFLGTVVNPLEPGRIAGGSSGGPAAAVASGAVVLGLGSDAAGSARIPAAYTGIYSLVPAVAKDPGLVSLQPGLEKPALMAQSPGVLAGAALLLGLAWPRPRRQVEALYVAEELLPVGDGARAFLEAVEALASDLGLAVQRGPLGVDPRPLHYARAGLSLSLACRSYRRLLGESLPRERLPPWEAKLLEVGCMVDRRRARRAFQAAAAEIQARLHALHEGGRVLAAPAVPGAPPTVEEAESDEALSTGPKLMRYTSPLSYPGIATATFPVEGLRLGETRIPYPVQLASPSTAALVQLAAKKAVSL